MRRWVAFSDVVRGNSVTLFVGFWRVSKFGECAIQNEKIQLGHTQLSAMRKNRTESTIVSGKIGRLGYNPQFCATLVNLGRINNSFDSYVPSPVNCVTHDTPFS